MLSDSRASPKLTDATMVPDIVSFARDFDSMPMNLERQVIELRVAWLVEDSLEELIDESMMSSVNFKSATMLIIIVALLSG
ncbi:hypothetical protein F3Y22_tig00111621pilonHSYRG00216 [Hibiscus syriacus]|uniref:Uncharacterized protein n=1 Tax=Hibiscus syriacus TaxID=106335 RepID=A0A6A2Y577_HIBSY|nr:hypothetical protein F3Y22_tig00111621pilonHSYRG00216 [Hibiscus syriacus]